MKEDREWLCFDGDTWSMTCSNCISFSSSTSVVKCSNNLAVVNENDLLLATSASVMITVSTKDDDNMDSDESDFEYEQLEEMNYFFISKYAAEE